MKATVVVNASAGSIAASEASATVSRVREAFERTSLEAEVLAISHEGFPAAARTGGRLGRGRGRPRRR